MNAHASISRRDSLTACALAIVLTVLLFAWSPSLRQGFSPLRAIPPVVTYCPSDIKAGNRSSEPLDPCARCARDPALIALSATMMLPQLAGNRTDTVMPPLDAARRLPLSMETSAQESDNRFPLLMPPRPMTPLRFQRLSAPATSAPKTPPPYRLEQTGDWHGRSVDISSLLNLNEPAENWSFSARLHYDKSGQVQHVLLESAALDLTLRNEVVRRLYQCRITPTGDAGEGTLTVYGPGRMSRP